MSLVMWYMGQCSTIGGVQTRYIGASTINVNASYLGPVQPSNFSNIQVVDTRGPTGTSSPGLNWTAGTGAFVFTSNTPINWTSCEATQATVQASPFSVHSMVCKPEWYVLEPQNTPNFRAPSSGTIKIAVPSGFSAALSAAEDAAVDWEAALGRTVEVRNNETCATDDPLCVELTNTHEEVPGQETCASFQGSSYNPTTGVWTGRGQIRFESSWSGGNADNLRRTIAHELGHYLGLQNTFHSSCTLQNTLMGGVDCYGTTAPPAGTALGPTAGNTSALMNSTYGNQVRNVCGW